MAATGKDDVTYVAVQRWIQFLQSLRQGLQALSHVVRGVKSNQQSTNQVVFRGELRGQRCLNCH